MERDEHAVVTLKDSKRTDPGSTSSVNTVICTDKHKANIENIMQKLPEVKISSHSNGKSESTRNSLKSVRSDWSRSRSHSPCSVQENLVSTSYRSRGSPRLTNKSKGIICYI